MADGRITWEIAREALAKLEVDPLGLDQMDHKLLGSVIDKVSGGPVGLDTLAASIGEDADTIEDRDEPSLLQVRVSGQDSSGQAGDSPGL
jgi:Holliday junction DNA helicase RuvB